jgi:hypothetical protein
MIAVDQHLGEQQAETVKPDKTMCANLKELGYGG